MLTTSKDGGRRLRTNHSRKKQPNPSHFLCFKFKKFLQNRKQCSPAFGVEGGAKQSILKIVGWQLRGELGACRTCVASVVRLLGERSVPKHAGRQPSALCRVLTTTRAINKQCSFRSYISWSRSSVGKWRVWWWTVVRMLQQKFPKASDRLGYFREDAYSRDYSLYAPNHVSR